MSTEEDQNTLPLHNISNGDDDDGAIVPLLSHPDGGEHSGLDLIDGKRTKTKNAKDWAKKKKIQCRKCIHYVKKEVSHRNDDICYCGYDKAMHHDNEGDVDSTEGWNLRSHTEQIPTDSVGTIKFVGFRQMHAEYIRVDIDTDVDVIWEMMMKVWKLKPPRLVISVTGGARNFQLKPGLKEAFRRGLVEAALSTDAWITSTGTHAGLMKYIGEHLAMRQSSQSRVVALGIAPWGCVYNKEILHCPEKSPVEYKMEVGSRNKHESSIDCNHTHFILVDNGTQHYWDVEIQFRTNLERTIAKKSRSENVTIPIVLVVVEGGPGTLETVHSSIQNDTPALVIEGSGRAADILSYAFNTSTAHSIEYADCNGKLDKLTFLTMPDEVEVEVARRLKDAFKDSTEENICLYIEWIKQCLQYPNLLSVFKLDSSDSAKKIDLEILKASLKANGENVQNQLHLSLMWNRVDVAKSDIFTEDRHWEKEDLYEPMQLAISNGRVDFVKLFLEHGVRLGEFLTSDRLVKLYHLATMKSPLRKMLDEIRQEEQLTLVDIENLIKQQLGDFYDSKYLTEDSKENHEHAERDLFLWSILFEQFDLAKFFWEKNTDALSAALFANGLLKSLQRNTSDVPQKRKLQTAARDFRLLAVGLLKTCYEKDRELTQNLLEKKSDMWGKACCLTLAIESENKEFIAHCACQDVFNQRWWGKMEHSNKIRMIFAVLLPVPMFLILKFKRPLSEPKDNKTVEEGDSHNNSTSTLASSGAGSRQDLDSSEKFKAFMVAPVTKFCYSVLSFLAFLLLYSYIMLARFRYGTVSTPEIVLMVWAFTMLLEEIRQLWTSGSTFCTRAKNYLRHGWNIVDAITISVFFAGVLLRFCPNKKTFSAARVFLALDLFVFYVRLLHIFSVSKVMGPKLVMIKKMVQDLLYFFVIMLVFMIGYAMTSQSILYPNTDIQPSLVIEVMRKAYWQMFGELFLDEIEGKEDCVADESLYTADNYNRCPSDVGKVMAPMLLALYMLLTNVLMLNLLIAMFSNTFQAVQDRSDQHWYFMRYKLVDAFVTAPKLPPPFIIICHMYRLCCFVIKQCKTVSDSSSTNAEESNEHELRLEVFEEDRRDDFVSETKRAIRETADHKISTTADRMDTLITKVEDLQVRIQERDSNLQTQIAALAAKIVAPETAKTPEKQYTIGTVSGMPSSELAETCIGTCPEDHPNARSSKYMDSGIYRFEVTKKLVKWHTECRGYRPPSYTSEEIKAADWADKADLKTGKYTWNEKDETVGIDRTSAHGSYEIEDCFPLNPVGRTGMKGRGNLGRWGPNHAADVVITRWKRDRDSVAEKRLEFIAVKRKDNRYWSLPGAFLWRKEYYTDAIKRSFIAEAIGSDPRDQTMEELFQDGQEVFAGYVDDSKNTDNAWVETKVLNYHDDDGSMTKGIRLKAGGQSVAVAWLPVWPKIPMQSKHMSYLKKVAEHRRAAF